LYRRVKGFFCNLLLFEYRYNINHHMTPLTRRPRRNRQTAALRALTTETTLSPEHLILPLFVVEGHNIQQPIVSMPGIYRHSLDRLLGEVEAAFALGIKAFAPFPSLPDSRKDSLATESYRPDGLYPNTIRAIKERFPEAVLFTDVAMDPYSSDGHDGLVRDGQILNDETLPILAQMAIVQAQAGADFIAPSDMMDGRVGYLRQALDQAGFSQVGILAYSAKYASAFYGPFRDALDSAPKFGDKKTYQMNPANLREAREEAALDYAEGADILMVKPAMPYLDVIRALREDFDIPIAAYQVSGEYAMLQAAAQQGWLNLSQTMNESLLAIRRAGADMILTYFAKDFAQQYKQQVS
jgi:porphobilinogen synthase